MGERGPRRISVVVPTCNRPAMLREALGSIRALESPGLSFEILVGDNGDAPETPAAAAEFGAIYLRVNEKGAGAARNAGLRAATGDYIAFLDDDDAWLPENIHCQLALLDSDPELDGAMAQVVSTDSEWRPIGVPWPSEHPGRGDELVRRMLSGYYPQIGATVIRTSVREGVGEFDETLLGDQDWDWQLRLARRRRLAFVAVPCVLFRQRASGTYDALRLRRLGFARRVFFRHAIGEWRLWGSPRTALKSYRLVIDQYYEYFIDAATSRAERGDRLGALRAIFGACRTFPLRAAYHLVAPRPLRRALYLTLAPRRCQSSKACPRP
jgi:glycosyltransferase involved in cell wall biosynthesis